MRREERRGVDEWWRRSGGAAPFSVAIHPLMLEVLFNNQAEMLRLKPASRRRNEGMKDGEKRRKQWDGSRKEGGRGVSRAAELLLHHSSSGAGAVRCYADGLLGGGWVEEVRRSGWRMYGEAGGGEMEEERLLLDNHRTGCCGAALRVSLFIHR